MRTFKIDYIVPNPPTLLRSSISNDNTDLTPFVDETVAELRSSCANMGALDYSVSWAELSSNTLARTWTSLRWGVDSWVPSNSFKIEFNPRFQWWDGSCASKPSSYYDLKSTMIHEVLHGVGYMSTIDSDKSAWPTNFDLLLRDREGEIVVKDGHFTGNMGDVLHIDNIRMYNPKQYNPGSSFSHEDTSGRLMSHAQTGCTPHFDKNSMIILNHLGYGCSYNGTSFDDTTTNTNTNTTFWLIGAAVVFIIVVAWCTCKKSRSTSKKSKGMVKSTNNIPLLQNSKHKKTLIF